jgi:hypothetical protein
MNIDRVLGIFIARPFLALGYARFRRPAVLVAALAWLAYVPYEQAMSLRILCTGECNIRVDLLLLYPVLAIVSLVAAFAVVKAALWPSRP